MANIEHLGPYKIGKTLGRGGMGTVYAATHIKSGEKVAVKLIAQHVADEPRFRRRFDREVETLQRLRHDGIVRLLGFGEENGQLFYSMELVEGESLQACIRRVKRLEWIPTIDFSIEICSALKHAHDIGVIHRDLKPANLIIGESGHIKLVDFGIAKIFGDTEHTAFGSVLGTADYMAPEQATSSGISSRTDLYALGSVMYAMLSGRPPFTGKKVTEVIESLTRDRPVPLDLVDPELPEELVELVHQLLAKSPKDRPPTALAVMNRLKSMRAGLQRRQTVLNRGPATVDNAAPTPKPRGPDADYTLDRDPQGATDDSDSRDKQGGKTVGSSEFPSVDPRSPTIAVRGPGNKTVLPNGSVAEDENANRTHFQTVQDGDVSPGVFGQVEPARQSSVTHWLAIGLMALILASGVGLFAWSLRPPTADELYQTSVGEEDNGAMKTFLRRFPDDPRHNEILDLQHSVALGGVLNRLRTRARLGLTPLGAAEESFVDVMSRDQYPLEAQKQLQQWLDVYDVPSDSPDEHLRELIQLARYEQQLHLDRPRAAAIDPRVEELLAKIQAAISSGDAESAKKRLSGIIELYTEQGWAEPAVAEAARALRTLE